jgi:hypothetical protein
MLRGRLTPMIAGMNGTIRVLWNCAMGEGCINKVRPGLHEEHYEMEQCRGLHTEGLQPEPTLIRPKRVSDRQC